MMKQLSKAGAICLAGMIVVFTVGQMAMAQTETGSRVIDPGDEIQSSEFVTINVKDANISEVLKAYSLQTGQSIVVGPDVVSDNVNVRLNNIPWQEALDVILKPYGFGYRLVGDTIIISRLENIIQVEGIEPLASKVFKLKYLDAYDIKDVCEAQLTGRGKFTVVSNKSLPGWAFGSGGGSGSGNTAATEGGIRQRLERKDQIEKSKTIVITDVPSSLTQISTIIEELDRLPDQILIEARFLEVSTDGLTDIGLDYIQAMETVVGETLPVATVVPAVDGGGNLLNPAELLTDPLQAGALGKFSQANGLRLSSSNLGDSGFDMLFALVAKDEDANVLSAPKLLTLNNQEAAILIGEKYPIIESQNNSGGGSGTTSTSLDYYENIGIQLNVVPQVCSDGYINMIVHPAISEIKGTISGITTSDTGAQSGTQYPIIRIREAETQIMIRSGNTAVIGGLQTERDKELIQKVPFLGDIPFLGRLFRRETLTKENIDLLIFIQGTIIDPDEYANESRMQQEKQERAMKLINEASEEEPVDGIAEDGESADVAEAPAAEEVAVAPAKSEAENEEILALVQSMESSTTDTNQIDTVEM